MTGFQGAVDATSPRSGSMPRTRRPGGEPVSMRVIAKRPDTIVGFGDTSIHADEMRATEVENPRG
jgi:hypothetical protein